MVRMYVSSRRMASSVYGNTAVSIVCLGNYPSCDLAGTEAPGGQSAWCCYICSAGSRVPCNLRVGTVRGDMGCLAAAPYLGTSPTLRSKSAGRWLSPRGLRTCEAS